MNCQRLIFLLVAPWVLSWTARAQSPDDFFESKVRPVLATQCFSCHTDSQLGGLRLDSREAMLRGGKSGPALVPGDPDKSLLVIAMRQTGALKMPKGGKLPQDQIDAIAQWVRTGAVWPATGNLPVAKSPSGIDPARRAFWSFQPLRPVPPPAIKDKRWDTRWDTRRDTRWPVTDIDRFILARLEKENLTPVGPADRRTLLRRATLDLTGLPPTPEEI
ncbi:MAG: DUF1549 domain-containing protein, partial [Blastocatellia bacterium]